MRARCALVVTGIDSVIRLQANGDTQLERTLDRAMSSAIDSDKADDAKLSGAVIGLTEIADQA